MPRNGCLLPRGRKEAEKSDDSCHRQPQRKMYFRLLGSYTHQTHAPPARQPTTQLASRRSYSPEQRVKQKMLRANATQTGHAAFAILRFLLRPSVPRYKTKIEPKRHNSFAGGVSLEMSLIMHRTFCSKGNGFGFGKSDQRFTISFLLFADLFDHKTMGQRSGKRKGRRHVCHFSKPIFERKRQTYLRMSCFTVPLLRSGKVWPPFSV